MRKLLFAIVAALPLLTGCAGGIPGDVVSPQDATAVQAFLQKAAASQLTGLQAAYNDFAAATPQRQDGMQCVGVLPDPTKPIDNVGLTNVGTGAFSIVAAVQREVAANPPGNGLTPEEIIAKASIYQPGSQGFNWVITQIETGCVAYLHNENQAINSTAGIFSSAALTQLLAGAPMGVKNRRGWHIDAI